MRILFILLISQLSLQLSAQSLYDLDSKHGYKDIQFGKSLDSLQLVAKVSQNKKSFEAITTYTVHEKKYLSFYNFKVENLEAMYYNKTNQLYGFHIFVPTSSFSQYNELESFFKTLYGEPTSSTSLTAKWVGHETVLLIQYSISGDNTVVGLYDKKILNLANQDLEKETRKKGSADF